MIPDTYTEPLEIAASKYDISTDKRKSSFIDTISNTCNFMISHSMDEYGPRGFLPIEGMETYAELAKEFNLHIQEVARFIETPLGAVLSSAYLWHKRGINDLVDKNKFNNHWE